MYLSLREIRVPTVPDPDMSPLLSGIIEAPFRFNSTMKYVHDRSVQFGDTDTLYTVFCSDIAGV